MAGKRIEEEKAVVEKMIRLYCRKKEGNAAASGEEKRHGGLVGGII